LRTNLIDDDPARLWGLYLQLGSVEEAFKNLKGDLAIRPIFHQDQARIEAHIFIAFLAYCLHVTLGRRLHALAPGLTPRSVIEKFAAVQMIDLHIPTTDGRELMLTRYTEPEPELVLLLEKLKLVLPAQPEPKISAAQIVPPSPALAGPVDDRNTLRFAQLPNVSGLRAHPVEPSTNTGIGHKVEAAVSRRMGVGIERDIGDRIVPGDQPRAIAQPLLHHAERVLAARVVVCRACSIARR